MKRDVGKLLTLPEAEELTGRKISTWRQDILERRIPFVKLGKSVRIPLSVVEKMISDGWRDPINAA